jgi:hypothetical protein
MAITKSLVFQNVTVQNANGASPTTYDNHVVDTVEITVTPVNDTVKAGMTLAASYDVSFTVGLLNTNILSDSRVYSDTAAEPVLARIVFNGATGATNLNVGQLYINGHSDYSGNRRVALISGTIRTTNVAATIIES